MYMYLAIFATTLNMLKLHLPANILQVPRKLTRPGLIKPQILIPMNIVLFQKRKHKSP